MTVRTYREVRPTEPGLQVSYAAHYFSPLLFDKCGGLNFICRSHAFSCKGMAIYSLSSCCRASMARCLTRVWISHTTACFILASCTATTTPRVTRRPEPVPGKSAQIDSSLPVNVDASAYTPGRLQYELQSSSAVHVTAGDSTRRADSTRLTGIITATLVASPAQNTVTARVESDSISVATGGSTSIPIPSGEPLIFSINTQNGQVTPVNQQVRRDCTIGDADSPPIYGREVLPSIHARTVQTWVDTLYTSTCRGGALLNITRIAAFTRLPPSDSVVRLLRLTKFQITGNGRQWDQKIEVSGEGTAADTLRMSGSPLRLQEVSGSSEMKLSFRTQLRAQEFIQTSTTRLTLRRHSQQQ